ncbi:clasp N-terminal domain-containing protein, partial [Hysterangium stoloniferum]
CDSLHSFQQELSTLSDALSATETEETWDRIERALIRFGAIVKGGGFRYEKELVDGIKGLAKPINSAMNSERTRLSAAALECLTVIAPRIGLTFDALAPFFISHILRLSNRTNKVYVTRSQASVALIINYCHIPSLISHLLVACKDSKIVTGRVTAVEGILRALNKWDWTQKDIKVKVVDVEEVIRLTGRDKDAGIRQTSRKVFEAYKILFPERIEEYVFPASTITC